MGTDSNRVLGFQKDQKQNAQGAALSPLDSFSLVTSSTHVPIEGRTRRVLRQ